MSDALTTYVDTEVTTGNVLANDTDADGDTLSVSGSTQPSNGAAVDNVDGTFTYTPDPGFVGVDTFTYTVSDGNGGTDTTEVTAIVLSPPPSGGGDGGGCTPGGGGPMALACWLVAAGLARLGLRRRPT